VLNDARAAGERRLRDAVCRLRVTDAPLGDPGWVRNVNEPADLERLADLEGDRQRVGPLEGHTDERSHHHGGSQPAAEEEEDDHQGSGTQRR
jgi:hypothetical protein